MANETPARYWAYSHDLDGELVDNFGEFSAFGDAVDAVAAAQQRMDADGLMIHVYRVVDNEKDSSTVWVAGPVSHMKAWFGDQTGGGHDDYDHLRASADEEAAR